MNEKFLAYDRLSNSPFGHRSFALRQHEFWGESVRFQVDCWERQDRNLLTAHQSSPCFDREKSAEDFLRPNRGVRKEGSTRQSKDPDIDSSGIRRGDTWNLFGLEIGTERKFRTCRESPKDVNQRDDLFKGGDGRRTWLHREAIKLDVPWMKEFLETEGKNVKVENSPFG